jgi:hypothetical protein
MRLHITLVFVSLIVDDLSLTKQNRCQKPKINVRGTILNLDDLSLTKQN